MEWARGIIDDGGQVVGIVMVRLDVKLNEIGYCRSSVMS